MWSLNSYPGILVTFIYWRKWKSRASFCEIGHHLYLGYNRLISLFIYSCKYCQSGNMMANIATFWILHTRAHFLWVLVFNSPWIAEFWSLETISFSRTWWICINDNWVWSLVKFLYEWLSRTIVVNPYFYVLGNNISHLTCFPRTLLLPQGLEFMPSAFEAQLAFVTALTNRVWQKWGYMTLKLGHTYTTYLSLVLLEYFLSQPGCKEVHTGEWRGHI